MTTIEKFTTAKWFVCKYDLTSLVISKNGVSEILPNVFLGSSKIRYITNNQNEFDGIVDISCETFETDNSEIDVLKLYVDDNDDTFIVDYFEKVNDFIDSHKKVLIHCIAGISRSASFTIAYLMSRKQFSLINAIKHIKNKRSIIRPNDGFLLQLVIYEKYKNSKYPINVWQMKMKKLGLGDKKWYNDEILDIPKN